MVQGPICWVFELHWLVKSNFNDYKWIRRVDIIFLVWRYYCEDYWKQSVHVVGLVEPGCSLLVRLGWNHLTPLNLIQTLSAHDNTISTFTNNLPLLHFETLFPKRELKDFTSTLRKEVRKFHCYYLRLLLSHVADEKYLNDLFLYFDLSRVF